MPFIARRLRHPNYRFVFTPPPILNENLSSPSLPLSCVTPGITISDWLFQLRVFCCSFCLLFLLPRGCLFETTLFLCFLDIHPPCTYSRTQQRTTLDSESNCFFLSSSIWYSFPCPAKSVMNFPPFPDRVGGVVSPEERFADVHPLLIIDIPL